MKNITTTFIGLLVCCSLVGFGPEKTGDISNIEWISLEEAQKRCKTAPRKIIIDVYTTWCGPCKMMAKNTFTNPVIIDQLNNHYYAVKFDAESVEPVIFHNMRFINRAVDPNTGIKGRGATHDLAQYFEVTGFPTLLFLDEKMNLLQPISGYVGPAELEPMLDFVAANKYETTEWDAYLKTFKTAIITETSEQP